MPHSRGVFLAHPALLRRCRGKRLHHLQTVPQPDLAQAHTIGGINVLNSGHASLSAVFLFEADLLRSGNWWASSSARTAEVSLPRPGTFKPSPMVAPFHSIGSAGTRNGSPLELVFSTSPPGRSTCGSSNRSSGRLIGEKQMFKRSSVADRSAAFQR